MRYLGIDYGTKRVGIALSDEDGRIAFPKSVLPSDSRLLDEIRALCSENDISAIVLGESKDYHGEYNEVMKPAFELKERLERELDLPVLLEPEFMTSAAAERATPGDMLDASAAALILQSFLDRKKHGGDAA